MKKKNICLAAFAAVLILAGSAGSAWAYFTTYVEAQGTQTIMLGDQTAVEEPDVSDWTKHVVVASKEGSQPVYVRVKAFSGSQYPLNYSGSAKWTPGAGGYYYYSDILNAGGKTEELLIKITGVPEEIKEAMELNVAVIYETTPVLYDENGDPYADWNKDVTVEGGNNE